MSSNKKKLQGNVSLTTVLVTSAILLLSGTTLLFGSIDQGRISKDNVNYQLAHIRAYSCLEEALNRIKRTQIFEGSVSILYDNGQCEADVTIDLINNNIRMISINSNYEDYQINITKQVDISSSPFTISNQ